MSHKLQTLRRCFKAAGALLSAHANVDLRAETGDSDAVAEARRHFRVL